MKGEWGWLLSPLLRRFGEGLVSVVIFGSFPRGEAKEGSDLDVLIVVKGLEGDRLRLSASLAGEIAPPEGFPRPLSPIVMTVGEVERHPPILLDMVYDSLIVLDRGGFMKRILEDLRKRLKELGARRIRTERGWYWVLKPDAKLGEVVEI